MERDSGRWKLVRRSNKKEEEIIEEDTTKKTLHSSGVPSPIWQNPIGLSSTVVTCYKKNGKHIHNVS